jgi:hypothetical protein
LASVKEGADYSVDRKPVKSISVEKTPLNGEINSLNSSEKNKDSAQGWKLFAFPYIAGQCALCDLCAFAR